MPRQKTSINTFVFQKNKVSVDMISKIFIYIEAVCGLNRIYVLNKNNLRMRTIGAVYGFILNLIITVLMVYKVLNSSAGTDVFMNELGFIICSIYSFLSSVRLQKYFMVINTFDYKVGCGLKTFEFLKSNCLLNTFVCIETIFLTYAVVLCLIYNTDNSTEMILVRGLQVLELYFIGHLFSIVCPRIRLINHFVEVQNSPLIPNYEEKICTTMFELKNDARNKSCIISIEYAMKLYEIIITAHNFLVEAIKWQLSVILVTSFVTNLVISYTVISEYFEKKELAEFDVGMLVAFLSFFVGNSLALFLPCVHEDQLTREVDRLRKSLALWLYTNKSDKGFQSTARAFLALTKENDLSLSLLGMFKLDLSLPLKFISLLVSYLVIMLQFKKVLQTQLL